MFSCNDENRTCECRTPSCVSIILGILSAALFFTVGLIVGACAAWIVLWNIVPIIILAALLLLAIVLILIYRRCRCKCRR